jgi:hypothetical protein
MTPTTVQPPNEEMADLKKVVTVLTNQVANLTLILDQQSAIG